MGNKTKDIITIVIIAVIAVAAFGCMVFLGFGLVAYIMSPLIVLALILDIISINNYYNYIEQTDKDVPRSPTSQKDWGKLVYYCPTCEHEIGINQCECKHCKQKIIWNDKELK